jgi:hypothetical protein
MIAQTNGVPAVAGPYRVTQIFGYGRSLPRYVVIGRGNTAVRTPAGKRRTFGKEADAKAFAAALTIARGAQ